ncbi:MAG TPA: tetratricopeptide repeat protein [Steroidobacteraceae bacterium]|nr:tetratricopeptide repeat protein [Steroidobacteraceae bacterium]
MAEDVASGETPARLMQAIEHHRAGRLDSAEAGYVAHLQQFDGDPSGLHFLGLLRTQQGRNDEAIDLMTQAVTADPRYVDAWSNLAIAHFRKRDLQQAEACCRKALDIAPDFANAWANLGMTLRARDAVEAALAAWGRALELQPGMRNIAISYGHALYRLDRRPEALEFYRRWHQASPQDPIPRHMLAAAGGAEQPARASDGYVRDVFDDFAESFDQNLEQLQYRAPMLLHAALAEAGRLPVDGRVQVLDLGCGTGLCGPLFRPVAERLVGVDLSPKMLSKAAARGLYDQLDCGELTQWLSECQRRFDIVIAADVLCYFGDLSTVFARVSSVLAAGGTFACSLERLQGADPVPPYALLPHGRYQHGRAYVDRMLREAGFGSFAVTEAVLRYERSETVTGHIVVAR